ncbi:hypothetical protein NK918_24140, partial [Salmonella enterica subsp. enterica serovar Typhimurium]|nr:hypothetical protein [Salmonella enterica subsp. enterica serovar Typhimurium]
GSRRANPPPPGDDARLPPVLALLFCWSLFAGLFPTFPMNAPLLSHEAKRILLWVALGVVLFATLLALAPVLSPFLFAFIFAYILNPGVDW